MEQLSHSSGHCKVQLHHQWTAPRACLNTVWGAACLGRLGKSLCPNSPFVPSVTASMCHSQMLICSCCWSHTWAVTNSVTFISLADVIDIWEIDLSFFQGHERGTASFPAPSSTHCCPTAVGFLPFVQETVALPQGWVGVWRG